MNVTTSVHPATHPRGGFALMEVMLALLVFAYAGTSLAAAMHSIGKISIDIRKELVLTRVLDSELRRWMSVPQLEEMTEETALEEGVIDLRTEIMPIEDLENEKGLLLEQMFSIRVTATWRDGTEIYEESAETWRYAPLYRP